ncbi:MAG TPA: extracellular solute-binding protein, partial [Thermoanaerobaculia bacterium]|nr:extracellular solute-binding protein [Thermoanaerobaculia bacterium]
MRALCLLTFLVFAGCGPRTDDGTVTLGFWGLGREGEVVGEMVPELERLHPELRVDAQQIPWSAAHEKLLTAFVGDAAPDLAQVGNTWIPELAAIGAIEPLDPYLRGSRVPEADYFPGIWDTNVVDGHVWGIPWYVDTRLLYYRTDLLAEVGYPEMPRTWSGWFEAMRRLEAR